MLKSKKNSAQATGSLVTSSASENGVANLNLRGGASFHAPPPTPLNSNNIAGAFNRYFGNATRLENWQRLCRDVGVKDDLPSITKCKEVPTTPKTRQMNIADDQSD